MRISEESGKIGRRKEKEFVDDDLTTGETPDYIVNRRNI